MGFGDGCRRTVLGSLEAVKTSIAVLSNALASVAELLRIGSTDRSTNGRREAGDLVRVGAFKGVLLKGYVDEGAGVGSTVAGVDVMSGGVATEGLPICLFASFNRSKRSSHCFSASARNSSSDSNGESCCVDITA